jgi:DNA-binding transcriptional regulator YhcF (GntR family)
LSIKVMTWVWDAFPASGSELLAMLALADWANDDGGSLYPSIRAIADKIRVSESQARRILRKFEADGYLSVVGNHGGGAPGTTRNYRLNVTSIKALSVQKELDKTTGCMGATPGMDARDGLHGCARGVASVRETGGMGATQTTNEPSDNHQEQNSHAADAPDPIPDEPPETPAVKFNPKAALAAAGVDPKVAADWLAVRKTKKAALTETALAGVVREANKAGLSLDAALRICCERAWSGFNASWVSVTSTGNQPPVFNPHDSSTWGIGPKGNFSSSLYLQDEAKAYRMLNGIPEAQVDAFERDMGAAEVVE